MGTFICGIHPEGPAGIDGQLNCGDEILKVNFVTKIDTVILLLLNFHTHFTLL